MIAHDQEHPPIQWPQNPPEHPITATDFTAMQHAATTTIVLKRNAIMTALPTQDLLADPNRSSNDLTYVLFENTDDNTQRQYVITIQEVSPISWRMIVNANPPVTGMMLLSIGRMHNFMVGFKPNGEACFEDIPVELIFDTDGPDFEFAVLPPPLPPTHRSSPAL